MPAPDKIAELVDHDRLVNVFERVPISERCTDARHPDLGEDNPEASGHTPLTVDISVGALT